jgi:hypothetical protein
MCVSKLFAYLRRFWGGYHPNCSVFQPSWLPKWDRPFICHTQPSPTIGARLIGSPAAHRECNEGFPRGAAAQDGSEFNCMAGGIGQGCPLADWLSVHGPTLAAPPARPPVLPVSPRDRSSPAGNHSQQPYGDSANRGDGWVWRSKEAIEGDNSECGSVPTSVESQPQRLPVDHVQTGKWPGCYGDRSDSRPAAWPWTVGPGVCGGRVLGFSSRPV